MSSPNKSNLFIGNNFILVKLPFKMSDLILHELYGESAVKPLRTPILFPVLPVINCCPEIQFRKKYFQFHELNRSLKLN